MDKNMLLNENLPVVSDKELIAMNQLMMDKRYRIKSQTNFLRPDRSDKVNPDFVLYTLNDYMGHLQKCVAATKKMIPYNDNRDFYEKLSKFDIIAYKLITIICDIDLKLLSSLLIKLQKNVHEVSIGQLGPFVQVMFQSLIRVYYLGSGEVSKKYKIIYNYILKELVPSDLVGLKQNTTSAIEEWHYIFDQIFTGMYPIVLRMCSSVVLSPTHLFYTNGSRVLTWLKIPASEVLILRRKGSGDNVVEILPVQFEETKSENQPKNELPIEVQEGLEILERLFPEAGWDNLETMPDFGPYFQPLLQFSDAFTQLAPDNPLQLTLILLWILEELFQGLRLIKFTVLPSLSQLDESEDIYKILEDWILYQENVFEKSFSADLKEFTHQIYTQPEYNKSPYGRTLLSNMYTLIKTVFLPHFDIRMFGTAKFHKDDRLPPFFLRVMRLKRILGRYNDAIKSVTSGNEINPAASVTGIQNPWEQYKFDISNPVSRRLNAICGGKMGKIKTNALLIQYTLSILHVLDWWINDKESYAYTNTPDYLYRVVESGSSVPAFGIKVRTDIEAVFIRNLKTRASLVLPEN